MKRENPTQLLRIHSGHGHGPSAFSSISYSPSCGITSGKRPSASALSSGNGSAENRTTRVCPSSKVSMAAFSNSSTFASRQPQHVLCPQIGDESFRLRCGILVRGLMTQESSRMVRTRRSQSQHHQAAAQPVHGDHHRCPELLDQVTNQGRSWVRGEFLRKRGDWSPPYHQCASAASHSATVGTGVLDRRLPAFRLPTAPARRLSPTLSDPLHLLAHAIHAEARQK